MDMQGHIHLLRQVHILEKAILHHLQQDMQQPLLIQKFLQGPLRKQLDLKGHMHLLMQAHILHL